MSIDSYYDGSDVLTADNGSDNYTKISPSSIAKFFSHPRQWYGETLLDEEGFQGSEASILGTIVHHFAEQTATGKHSSNRFKDVKDYLNLQEKTLSFDRSIIEDNWEIMTDTLITEQVQSTKFHSVEEFIYHPILPGIYAAGTYDAITYLGNQLVLRDYKTASKKPSGISYDYRTQLHEYAWILRQKGIKIDYIELCFVVRPTKTLPARTFIFKEPFTDIDYDKIDGQLKVIADSVNLWNTQPDLRYILAQDYRLKPKEKAKLFKD